MQGFVEGKDAANFQIEFYFKFYIFNCEFVWDSNLESSTYCVLRQKFTIIYIIFDNSFALSGRKRSVIGRENIKDGCVGVNSSRNMIWGKFDI